MNNPYNRASGNFVNTNRAWYNAYAALRKTYPNFNDYNQRSAVELFTHEFGHALGLAHVNNKSDVMNSQASDLTYTLKDSISASDLNQVRYYATH